MNKNPVISGTNIHRSVYIYIDYSKVRLGEQVRHLSFEWEGGVGNSLHAHSRKDHHGQGWRHHPHELHRGTSPRAAQGEGHTPRRLRRSGGLRLDACTSQGTSQLRQVDGWPGGESISSRLITCHEWFWKALLQAFHICDLERGVPIQMGRISRDTSKSTVYKTIACLLSIVFFYL